MNAMRVETGKCIRCGACAILAPGILVVEKKGPARIARPPATPVEERRALAALLNCPTAAVTLNGAHR